MNKFLFILFLCLPFLSFAKLPKDYKSLLTYAQEKFSQGHTPYPIHIFDRDEVEWLLTQEKAWGKAKRVERWELLIKYVHQKTGVQVSMSDAGNIDSYLHDIKNSAAAMPIFDTSTFGERKTKVCLVFPNSINTHQKLELHRLTGLGNKEAYPTLKLHHIKHKLSLFEYQALSLLHEVAHCLDQRYMPKVYSEGEDPHDIHLSESFAETMALLLLAQEGHTDIAQRRSMSRSIYSRKVGQYYAQNPSVSFGIASIISAGAVYYLSDSINATQDLIETQLENLRGASFAQLEKSAQAIVNENALHFRSFTGVSYYLANGEEQTLATYGDYAFDFPDLFANTLEDISEYIEKTNLVLEDAFDFNQVPELYVADLKPLNHKRLCILFMAGDKKELMQNLSLLRKNLHHSRDSFQNLQKRSNNLIDFFENLNSCAVEKITRT